MVWIWNENNLSAAIGRKIDFPFKGKRINIDSRKIAKGDIFVALKGENFNGNKFAEEALKKGAVACIVDDKNLKGAKFIHVDDSLKALQKIGRWRRKSSYAKFIAITGSVGKTGAKEMLYAALSKQFTTYKTEGNFNNHIGLPLTLANMPDDTELAVIEFGMNHAGEISELVRICKPDIAAITWVSEAHIEFFDSEEDIARAKAEIFEWMAINGSAVIPNDNEHFDLLNEIATESGVTNIYAFGMNANAVTESKNGVKAYISEEEVTIPNSVKEEQVLNNVLLVLTVCAICEADLKLAVKAIAEMGRMKGRGERFKLKSGAVIIDDSYNASPTAMRLAIENLAKEKAKRKIAVLGDMKELGDKSKKYHEGLAQYLKDVDVVVTCGKDMKFLHDKIKSKHFGDINETKKFLDKELKSGDVALIKGSHGSNMYKIVDMLSSK